MKSMMNSIGGAEGTLASGGAQLPDAKHGSAAGTDPRTGDVATAGGLAATPRACSPLGEGTTGNINDDALPSNKRRAVSREILQPPPGFIIQTVADGGAAERSLDLSSESEKEHDVSMPGAQLERRAVSERPLPRSRAFFASPRVRAHLPPQGRDKQQRAKRMPLSRGSSPKP